MSNGQLVQTDSPYNLWNDRESIFYKFYSELEEGDRKTKIRDTLVDQGDRHKLPRVNTV